MLRLSDFVNLGEVANGDLFPEDVVQLLSSMKLLLETVIISSLQKTNDFNNDHHSAYIEGLVYIDATAEIEHSVYIKGPCYIGPGAQIRHGAYIRGNVYVGKNAIVGHCTEVKNSVLFDEAKASHFNYVGDSVLGKNVNLGAGTKIANLRLDSKDIILIDKNNRKIETNLRKFGAILGSGSQTGCNSVLSPGSLLYPNTIILPNEHFKGTKC